MLRAAWILLITSLLGAGCRPEAAPPAPSPAAFETGEVRIASAADTFVLRVEIAENDRQHRLGLSRRPALPEDRGMIFLFREEQPRGAGFWMYRTRVALSVALLDAGGVIREIHDMEPCRSRLSLLCRRYRAAGPFRAALEVGRGYFARRGIGVGDRVTLGRDPREERIGPGRPARSFRLHAARPAARRAAGLPDGTDGP